MFHSKDLSFLLVYNGVVDLNGILYFIFHSFSLLFKLYVYGRFQIVFYPLFTGLIKFP